MAWESVVLTVFTGPVIITTATAVIEIAAAAVVVIIVMMGVIVVEMGAFHCDRIEHCKHPIQS